jgi:hypothetical protein
MAAAYGITRIFPPPGKHIRHRKMSFVASTIIAYGCLHIHVGLSGLIVNIVFNGLTEIVVLSILIHY